MREAVFKFRVYQRSSASASPSAGSIEHLLERKSAVRERELFAEALAHHRGAVSVNELRRLTDAQGLLRTGDGELTTRAVLEKEWEIVCWAKEGKGASAPLNSNY